MWCFCWWHFIPWDSPGAQLKQFNSYKKSAFLDFLLNFIVYKSHAVWSSWLQHEFFFRFRKSFAILFHSANLMLLVPIFLYRKRSFSLFFYYCIPRCIHDYGVRWVTLIIVNNFVHFNFIFNIFDGYKKLLTEIMQL